MANRPNRPPPLSLRTTAQTDLLDIITGIYGDRVDNPVPGPDDIFDLAVHQALKVAQKLEKARTETSKVHLIKAIITMLIDAEKIVPGVGVPDTKTRRLSDLISDAKGLVSPRGVSSLSPRPRAPSSPRSPLSPRPPEHSSPLATPPIVEEPED
jgi:hypothetical protein